MTDQAGGIHPATKQLLRYFEWEHLPLHLQPISRAFQTLALQLVQGNLSEKPLDGPELTTALRKLLEAKDCAVRAAL